MSRRLLRGIPLLAGLVAVWISTRAPRAEDPPPPSSPAGVLASLPTRGLASAIAEAGQIEVPAVDPAAPLSIRAGQASRWTEGSYDVWHLTGGATIAQGATTASAHEAVIWIEQQPSNTTDLVDASAASPPVRSVLVRMAGNVEVEAGERSTAAIRGPSWAGRFWTFRDPQLDFASVVPPPSSPVQYQGATAGQAFAGDPEQQPGSSAGDGTIQLTSGELPLDEVELLPPTGESGSIDQAQFTEFAPSASPQAATVTAARRLRAFPRSSMPLNVRWYPSPGGGEWVAVITSGVNLVIDGVDPAGPLDISADRLVIWTQAQQQPSLDGSSSQAADVPMELYMEGNVIFRQAQRVVEAVSMYYDVPRSSGVITGATVLTPVSNY